MIEFNNVTKVYGNGTEALKDVNLKIDKGEFVFVIGPSGAGKSTFIKLLLREETPTKGTIEVNGYNLNKIKRRHIPQFRRSLGVVFQDFRLIPNMTVYDNVAFALRVTNVANRSIRQRVPYILNLVGLASKARNYPSELSGGEQQRVALARALVNNPSLLIADEPTGNIDPEMSLEIVELLNEINKCGTTIVMVTHAHNLVSRFDRRVITINHGNIVSDGSEWGSFYER
ncbi:MAG: cell division ATP-binding protein FtsE [Negativibacillus sp.]